MNNSDRKESVGFICLLIGLLLFLIGLIYIAMSFLQPGSPAVFTLQASIIVTTIGLVLGVFGLWVTQTGRKK